MISECGQLPLAKGKLLKYDNYKLQRGMNLKLLSSLKQLVFQSDLFDQVQHWKAGPDTQLEYCIWNKIMNPNVAAKYPALPSCVYSSLSRKDLHHTNKESEARSQLNSWLSITSHVYHIMRLRSQFVMSPGSDAPILMPAKFSCYTVYFF